MKKQVRTDSSDELLAIRIAIIKNQIVDNDINQER
jgi:hypothetical protein